MSKIAANIAERVFYDPKTVQGLSPTDVKQVIEQDMFDALCEEYEVGLN